MKANNLLACKKAKKYTFVVSMNFSENVVSSKLVRKF